MCVYTSKVLSLKVILLCVMIGWYITLIAYSGIVTKGGAGMEVGLGLVILYENNGSKYKVLKQCVEL